MLDSRVRKTLLDYEAGRCDLETAAQQLFEVRRETGCLEIHAPANASDATRRLAARFAELARDLPGA